MREHFLKLWNNPKVVAPATLPKTNMSSSPAHKEEQQENVNVILLGKSQSSKFSSPYQSPYKLCLIEMLKEAQTSVDIMVNNINDKEILQAIAACANKGVQINFILGRYHGDTVERLPFAGGRIEKVSSI